MKKGYRFLVLLLLIAVVAEGIFCIYCIRSHRHADIDAWSGDLTALAVEYVEAAKGYGVEKEACQMEPYEYGALLELLEKTVTEDNASRSERAARLESGYRLAFQYQGRLWLFQCCEDGWVSLTFEYVETGAYYGCENGSLYLDSPELWNYIVDTVDAKASPKARRKIKRETARTSCRFFFASLPSMPDSTQRLLREQAGFAILEGRKGR